MRWWTLFSLLVAASGALGCSDKDDDDDDDDDEDEDSATSDDTGTTTQVSPEAPVITGLSYADCSLGTDGQDIWIIQVSATDPQGDDTIRSGEVAMSRGATVVNTYPVVCNNGVCSTSWEATAGTPGEADCSLKGTGSMGMTVVDEDGNRSALFTHPL